MVTVRALPRAARNWTAAARAASIAVLGTLLAVGSLVFAPAKAFAAVPEVRTPLPLTYDTAGMLVASGSDVVFGTHRSTDGGVTWTQDATLPGSTVYRWHADGLLLWSELATTGGVTTQDVVVYTLSTGTSQRYPLPQSNSAPSSMSGEWMLAYGTTAYNFVTGTSVSMTVPSGATLIGVPEARLTPEGSIVWTATTSDNHTVFATSASPSAPPSAWTTIDVWGYSGWTAGAGEFQYLQGSGSDIQFCSKPLSNLAAVGVCSVVWSGPTSNIQDTWSELDIDGSSTVIEINLSTSRQSDIRGYVATGSTVNAMQLPSGSQIMTPGCGGAVGECFGGPYVGDTPFVGIQVPFGGQTVRRVNVDGSLGVAITPPTSRLPQSPAVGLDRLVGLEAQQGDGSYSAAWTRPVSASGIGGETVISNKAGNSLWVSSGRTVVSGPDGLSVYDRGQLSHTFADPTLTQLSGPYVEQTHYAGGNPTTVISTVDGTEVATFPSDGQLFGSRFVTYSDVTNGVIHTVVNDLTGASPPRSVDLAVGDSSSCNGFQVWYDYAAVSCYSPTSGQVGIVFNLATGAVVKATPGGTWIESLNEGFVVTGSYDSTADAFVYELIPLSGDPSVPLADCSNGVQSDGVGQLACSSATELIWRDFAPLSTSAGRVLGWLAPTSFASGTWTPQIDATKPFTAGVLRISQGSTVVRELTVPASADGSVRGVSWDGKNTAGVPVPSGTYTATLVVNGKDGSGPVMAVDGTSAPAFDVAWMGAAAVGAPGSFVSLSPSRLLDSRTTGGAFASKESRSLQVTGRGGVPSSNVSAVMLNVTVTETTSGGYLTVSPTGTTRPTASNLNWDAGVTIPNAVTVKVGDGGKVDLFQSGPGTAQVIVDVAGYVVDGTVADAGGYTALPPARILDTRTTGGKLVSGETRDLQVTGTAGVPASNVSAVVLNVTVTEATSGGYLTAFPTGTTRPTASNLNWAGGATIPNLVTVKLGDGGKVSLFQSGPGTAQVIADVAGYYLGGTASKPGMFVAVAPARVLDTRSSSAVAGGGQVSLAVLGKGEIPASGVAAVVVNTTVTETTQGGYLTVYPGATTLPTASNLNWGAGATIPNLVTVGIGSDQTVVFYNGSPGTVQVIADTAGYYLT